MRGILLTLEAIDKGRILLAGIGGGLACWILDSEDDHLERTLQELYVRPSGRVCVNRGGAV
jgi:hypothetical protein